MHQVLGMLAAFALGIMLFGALTRAVVLRLGLRWRDALMYFGVLPYPDDLLRSRQRPARREP
ncbi:MAG: hypothetical protein ACJ76S_01890 [Solirubrobacteraceae bacterium]